MPFDPKKYEQVQRILGDPEMYPDEMLSWILKKLADNPFFKVAATQLPIEEPFRYVGNPGEPAFVSPFLNYGSGWQPLGFRKDPFNTVFVTGLVKTSGSVAYNATITTLPAGFRPEFNQMRAIFVDSNTVVGTVGRVDVMANGDIIWREGPGVPNPTTLDYMEIDLIYKAFS